MYFWVSVKGHSCIQWFFFFSLAQSAHTRVMWFQHYRIPCIFHISVQQEQRCCIQRFFFLHLRVGSSYKEVVESSWIFFSFPWARNANTCIKLVAPLLNFRYFLTSYTTRPLYRMMLLLLSMGKKSYICFLIIVSLRNFM